MPKELPTAVCVLDMASLHVRAHEQSTTVEVCAATGETLVSFESALSGGALVLDAFDQVLATATVLRRNSEGAVVKCKVGLLNPFTSEVAFEPLPRTKSYEHPENTAIPLSGVVGSHSAAGLTLYGSKLVPVELRRDGLVRCAALHTV